VQSENERFVDFAERNYQSTIHNFYSDFVDEYTATIKRAKWNHFKWKGLTLMKDPMSLAIYQQLLQDLRPGTIWEFGTYEGGTTLWMKDVLDSVGASCDVHTFDIAAERCKLSKTDGIAFHRLDNHRIKEFVSHNPGIFEAVTPPLLVIEDSHENLAELLEVVDEFLKPGDYLIVEDTLAEWKHEALRSFLDGRTYQVDTHYCDFWGHNNSWMVNSVLRKGDVGALSSHGSEARR
jgi:cephalosporin hydroxylase